ncbi:MAG TPA: hypothetical protein VGS41_02570, partial [Chthonomonadales bacterium]|nr:hypothetical protein [Chthonomonadales bacterium]
PWAMAIEALIRSRTELAVDLYWTDDGIVFRFPERETAPPLEMLLPDPDEVEELVIRQLGSGGQSQETMQGSVRNSLFSTRFREAASRALLLPRKRPGQRAPLWQQRLRAANLLTATAGFGSFPIVLETFRECMRDVFDLPALVEILRQVRSGAIQVVSVTTRAPSPFAAAIMFSYVANFIYEGDAPLAERRAQALRVDPAQLRELLGDAELRELLDSESMVETEQYLQCLTPLRMARHADGLHDLLLRIGDLSEEEVSARCAGSTQEWIAGLISSMRIVAVTVAGTSRYVAAEDAGRYRDAFGVSPPAGLPDQFLEPAPNALEELISRYARTHGPFAISEICDRYAIGNSPALMALSELEESGRVVEGEFRPDRSGREWCDPEVLKALRQKSLARLRHEVESVDRSALGRFYLDWQLAGGQEPRASLLAVVEQLQGAVLIASELESKILPARIPDFDLRELDSLTASGAVMWVGRGAIAPRDGRISLYVAESAHLYVQAEASPLAGPVHKAIRDRLQTRGASFFSQIVQACGGAFPPDVEQALWEMVWAGEVTNDTFQPLRAAAGSPAAGGRREEVARARAARVGLPRAYRSAPGMRLPSPETAGRWSLVSSLIDGTASITERRAAEAIQLLELFGVITRETSAGIEGGFAAIYPVLRSLEEAGRVRRGYFVSGLGAAQFALPAALERLRALRDPPPEVEPLVISSTDPANPYGAALPWPERREGRRPTRSAGSSVMLIDGALAAWMARDETQILTFPLPDRSPEEAAAAVAAKLASMANRRRSVMIIEEIDASSALDHSLADALIAAGFQRRRAGLAYKRGFEQSGKATWK